MNVMFTFWLTGIIPNFGLNGAKPVRRIFVRNVGTTSAKGRQQPSNAYDKDETHEKKDIACNRYLWTARPDPNRTGLLCRIETRI